MSKNKKRVVVSESEESSDESKVESGSDVESLDANLDGTLDEESNETNENVKEKEQQPKKAIPTSTSRTSTEYSTSSEISNVSSNKSEDDSIEYPQTDSEGEAEEEAVAKTTSRRQSQWKRIVDSDESSDEEDKLRHSRYEAESDSEGHLPPIEDKAFSKATRRSINGFGPRRSSVVANSDDSSDDESDSLIDVNSGDEMEDRPPTKEEPVNLQASMEREPSLDDQSQASEMEDSRLSPKEPPILSSTLRSPLKEINNNQKSIVSNDSFNNSIGTKMSSTISKDDSYLLDEAAGGGDASILKMKVSQSTYDAEAIETAKMEARIASMAKMLDKCHQLPDKGVKLQHSLNVLLEEVESKKRSMRLMEIDQSKSLKNEITKSFNSDVGNKSKEACIVIDDEDDFKKLDNIKPQYVGKIGMQNFVHQKALTVEKLEEIKKCIDTRPMETEIDTPPKYLKVELMKHQLHGIKFMSWRETQSPRGGILADDMGLGKTLTAISLVLKSIQAAEEAEEESESDDDDEEGDQQGDWKARGRKDLHDGGTLVVCPASLIKQWEQEIKDRTKRNALTVVSFHGAKREYKARRLARADIVLTTYQLVVNEEKNGGCLFGIKWKRIILDEGHVIRNHKSKQSMAICKLQGKYRWVMTGTPIQNKEFDLFAAVKFLRCQPFDDLTYWKRWIEQKGGSSPRVQALLNAIMLRRTKQQLMESGEVQTLPNKTYKLFSVKLNPEERNAYNKFLAFSQSLFAAFLIQQQEKNENFNYNEKNLKRLHSKFAKNLNIDRVVKAHEILTLLMRLRQICCHPGLVRESLLQHENNDGNALHGENDEEGEHDESDSGLLQKLQHMNIRDDGEGNQPFNADSEVFNMDLPSSKILHMMNVLREYIVESDNKAIIVSQWTSHLRIIRGMLEVEGITYCELNGSVPVKDRNDIVVHFNNPKSGIKIMLLSLTAGGVGLNLVGANYLFLMDLHWNPQLEQQAQDRIYRFGQKKEVNVFKFYCEDTIEERILKIQEQKLGIATDLLTGTKKTAGSKLTVDDLKDLFGMNG